MTSPGPSRAPLVLLGASAVWLSALSWGRWILLREPSPDHFRLAWPLAVPAAILLVLAVGCAFVAHRALVADAHLYGLRRLVVLAAVVGAVAGTMLPLLSNDLFSLLAYTDLLWNSEVNPITLTRPGMRASRFLHLVSPAWKGMPCVYGPLQLVYWAPALAGQGMSAVLGAKILAVGGHLAMVGLMAWHARSLPAAQQAPAFALAALGPVLWVEGVGQAHADLPTAVFVAAWLALAARGHVALAGAALGLAIASKLTALVVAGMYLVYLLAENGYAPGRRLLRATLAGLAMLAAIVPFYALVWHGHWTFVVPLRALGIRWPTHTFFEVVFQALLVDGVKPAPMLAVVNRTATGLTAVVAVIGIVAAARSRSVGELAGRVCAVFILSVTLGTPVFHAWYLVPALPLALEVRDAAWRRWILVAASWSVLLGGSCLFPWYGLAHDMYRVGTVTFACVVSVWMLRGRLAFLGLGRVPSGTES